MIWIFLPPLILRLVQFRNAMLVTFMMFLFLLCVLFDFILDVLTIIIIIIIVICHHDDSFLLLLLLFIVRR